LRSPLRRLPPQPFFLPLANRRPNRGFSPLFWSTFSHPGPSSNAFSAIKIPPIILSGFVTRLPLRALFFPRRGAPVPTVFRLSPFAGGDPLLSRQECPFSFLIKDPPITEFPGRNRPPSPIPQKSRHPLLFYDCRVFFPPLSRGLFLPRRFEKAGFFFLVQDETFFFFQRLDHPEFLNS